MAITENICKLGIHRGATCVGRFGSPDNNLCVLEQNICENLFLQVKFIKPISLGYVSLLVCVWIIYAFFKQDLVGKRMFVTNNINNIIYLFKQPRKLWQHDSEPACTIPEKWNSIQPSLTLLFIWKHSYTLCWCWLHSRHQLTKALAVWQFTVIDSKYK